MLVLIACQSCGHEFRVGMDWYRLDTKASFEERITKSRIDIYYGDPPNIGCCLSGPTETAVLLQVLEFWRKDSSRNWVRCPELEVSLEDE
jgi:hypothetical protein